MLDEAINRLSCDYSIIFVHGLQGHPQKTWSCEKDFQTDSEGSREGVGSPQRSIKNLFWRAHRNGHKGPHRLGVDEVFWPLDLLPEDCVNSRILTWGYDSMISHFFRGPANQSNISAHAKNLLQALKIRRLNCVSCSGCLSGRLLSVK